MLGERRPKPKPLQILTGSAGLESHSLRKPERRPGAIQFVESTQSVRLQQTNQALTALFALLFGDTLLFPREVSLPDCDQCSDDRAD